MEFSDIRVEGSITGLICGVYTSMSFKCYLYIELHKSIMGKINPHLLLFILIFINRIMQLQILINDIYESEIENSNRGSP